MQDSSKVQNAQYIFTFLLVLLKFTGYLELIFRSDDKIVNKMINLFVDLFIKKINLLQNTKRCHKMASSVTG